MAPPFHFDKSSILSDRQVEALPTLVKGEGGKSQKVWSSSCNATQNFRVHCLGGAVLLMRQCQEISGSAYHQNKVLMRLQYEFFFKALINICTIGSILSSRDTVLFLQTKIPILLT